MELRRLPDDDEDNGVSVEDITLPSDHSYCYSPDLLQDLELTSLTVPSPHLIRRCRKLRPKVTLNIGGSKHEVMWRLLETKPRYGLV